MSEFRKPTEEERTLIGQFDIEDIKKDLGQEVEIEEIRPTPPNLNPIRINNA